MEFCNTWVFQGMSHGMMMTMMMMPGTRHESWMAIHDVNLVSTIHGLSPWIFMPNSCSIYFSISIRRNMLRKVSSDLEVFEVIAAPPPDKNELF